MLSPVVTHVPCALDHQRRIADARREAVARRACPRGRRWPIGRVLGRAGPGREIEAGDLRYSGEDVWRSLRL